MVRTQGDDTVMQEVVSKCNCYGLLAYVMVSQKSYTFYIVVPSIRVWGKTIPPPFCTPLDLPFVVQLCTT